MVGIPDELTGQAVVAFVALKPGQSLSGLDQIKKDLVYQVRSSIGPFAYPRVVYIVEDLPKTRSGKIMRRILRKIVTGEEESLGDTSTVRCFLTLSTTPRNNYHLLTKLARQLSDPSVVNRIIDVYHDERNRKVSASS